MNVSDHSPIVIDQFNGLYRNGEPDSVPIDHFTETENLAFVGSNGIETRPGLGPSQDVAAPLGRITRVYNYITQDSNDLLVLREGGDIFHVLNGGITVLGPILSIPEMTDFGFVPYAGRAYLTPFTTYGTAPNSLQKGLDGEFLYVYLGEGLPARKAAGAAPTTGTLTIANGTGFTDAGFHLFGVVYETDTGYLTAPGRFTGFTTLASNGVSFSNIPVSPDSFVTSRRLVMTRVIPNYNNDPTGYQYFFIPSGRIADNSSTTLNNITVFDADLLEDASHLIDNFDEIPAGVGLTFYHNRMCLWTSFDDPSVVRVSAPGEPEAISELDGLIIAPLDGNPLTNASEMRDIFYLFKKNRTFAYSDNGDVPSSWPLTVVDTGLGCPVHGLATVVDSGSSSIDYLISTSFRGIVLFNGRYLDPELSWKIVDLWKEQDHNEYQNIQIVNNTPDKILYCALPDRRLLVGDYSNGLDPKKIRWMIWRFDIPVTSVALFNTSELIIGSDGRIF